MADPYTAPAPAGAPAPGGGALPWDAARGAANMDFSGNPASLGASYAGNYNAALAFNQKNYENVLGGYQQAAGQQAAGQQGIAGAYSGAAADLDARLHGVSQGYGALAGQVGRTIAGVDASQRQAIEDAYRAQAGQATQSLVGRGLGNTTVLDSVQRGLQLDRQKADVALSNQTAQLAAGYQSSIGLSSLGQQQNSAQALAAARQAGLGYSERALGDRTGLALNQLGFQNSVNAAYPNPQLYGQLAQQYGVTQQANADRAQLADLYSKLGQQAARQPQVPQAGGPGYQPAPASNFGRPTPSFDGTGTTGVGAGAPGGGGYGTQSPFFVGHPGGLAAPRPDVFDPQYGDAGYSDAGDPGDLVATVGPQVMAGYGGGGGYGGTPYGAMGIGLGLLGTGAGVQAGYGGGF